MICDHCEEEIVGDAICLDCFNIALLENQPKIEKTPLELAAGGLLTLLQGSYGYLKALPKEYRPDSEWFKPIEETIIKAQGNLSPPPNPAEPDECKSAE